MGAAMLLIGRAGLGGLLLSGAFAWYGYLRRSAPPRVQKTAGKRSTVRTAVLEMELDHDTGELEGLVLAGRHEQRVLGTMNLVELRELYADMTERPGKPPASRDVS